MYQKYSTEVIVLRSYERGEADRIFALYSREFGLVWARCSAVRRENSKMRYALQNYSHADISLVRGNRGWRVAGARPIRHLPISKGGVAFARIAHLVERLIKGEEKSDYLFMTLTEAHVALTDATSEERGAIELLCVARILYVLGYVSTEALGTALFTHTAYTLPHLAETEAVRGELLSSVNNALSQAQM